MKIKGLRHVGIFTKKIERMIEFYSKTFELKIVYDNVETFDKMLSLDEPMKVRVVKLASDNGSQIELLYNEDVNNCVYRSYFSYGLSHIAMTVENLDEIYLRLMKLGIYTFTNGPYHANEHVDVMFCEDPDGNILELVEEL